MSLVARLPPNARAWLSASRAVAIHENTAIVAVPDDFTRTQLETRCGPISSVRSAVPSAMPYDWQYRGPRLGRIPPAAQRPDEDTDSAGSSRTASVPAQQSGPPHAEAERFGSAAGEQTPLEHQGDTFLRRELGARSAIRKRRM
jgi:hypothetical protein